MFGGLSRFTRHTPGPGGADPCTTFCILIEHVPIPLVAASPGDVSDRALIPPLLLWEGVLGNPGIGHVTGNNLISAPSND